jgi:hypothetical protein
MSVFSSWMKGWRATLLPVLLNSQGFSAQTSPCLSQWSPQGYVSWTNAPVPGVCTLQVTENVGGAWSNSQNFFCTNSQGQAICSRTGESRFVRLLTAEIPPTPQGFTNLVRAYGRLETIAGTGVGRDDKISYWSDSFEGGWATNAALSRPHFAMADRAGNVFIVDKCSHSVLKVTPEGKIVTHAGTRTAGYNGDGAAATTLRLNYPNGMWVRGDGTVYVLDTDNGRVRRVDTNGVMTTLFATTSDYSALSGGRAFWVKDDESLAYFGEDKTKLRRWTPGGGVDTLAKGFGELGDIYVEPSGSLVVCDRGSNYVYRVTASGTKTILAGNGTSSGGGSGQPGTQTGLYGIRGVWPMPAGGYLLLEHDGCKLWYLNSAGVVYLLVNGAGGVTHAGDGSFFFAPGEFRINEGRSVSMDYQGNILICESDYGYIRRIRFQRLAINN